MTVLYVHQLDTATCVFGQLRRSLNSQIPIQQFLLSSDNGLQVCKTDTESRLHGSPCTLTILSINELNGMVTILE